MSDDKTATELTLVEAQMRARTSRERRIARVMAMGADTLGESLEEFKGQWVRTVRTVVFEGPAEKVFRQVGRSHSAPTQRNVGARSGCQITIVQGPLEIITEDQLLSFGQDAGEFPDA